MHSLVWFRNDLRVHDNPALHYALQDQEDATKPQVQAVYVLCDEFITSHPVGARKLWFVRETLRELQIDLAASGIKLDLLRVAKAKDIPTAIVNHCQKHNIGKVTCNAEYPLDEIQRDRATKHACEKADIDFKRYHDRCLVPPGALHTQQGDTYKVFTPFSKAWKKLVAEMRLDVYSPPKGNRKGNVDESALENCFKGLELEPLSDYWAPGEQAALKQLKKFCAEDIHTYHERRDFPAMAGTSGLSPYLAVGSLSPKQCLTAASLASDEHWSAAPGISVWVNELIWREFYMHVAAAFPEVCRYKPLQAYTDQVSWSYKESVFNAWCEGKTGVPIVDAAMVQLNTTGWMHNRLRMIVAMFLCKNLAIDWRWGERYFMQQLIDADFCANNGGWQWSASTGTDAAPYFRIMNPITQSERYDPKAEFICSQLPEFNGVKAKGVHRGEGAEGYPKPLVDVKLSRKQAIERFAEAKDKEVSL
ncbi:deoxyribodipyrimidine photo-lyase [Gilvimarinus sp. DA14]|uniref:cryptochrome/photolyase family protein n=1 Tax=Gilvimarinus sp. DA14 TaxID=2956798 RepID=UPI0020B659DB|nr:FAD-binding domain-containing protein [Gilvimarinus sp. DA14]UTF60707.1 deoxyribodipyrimidine photo-lyase [Gilvimarinus sp. DA14]